MEKNSEITKPEFSCEPAELVKEARHFLEEGFIKARQLHVNGSVGREVLGYLTKLVDDLLLGLLNAIFDDGGSASPPFTVLAVGGYGRGELSPGSDIDILLLCDNPSSKGTKKQVEKFVYPLWDLKLNLGYSVHDTDSCLELARKDFTVLTSLMDMRQIQGESGVEVIEKLWERLKEEVLPKTTEIFIKDHIRRVKERRRRYGESIFILEPNVKESPGGLRDLHSALWMAKVVNRVRSMEELIGAEIISARDWARVESALDFLWTIRNELHFQAGRKDDRLTFNNQERMSLFLGYRDKGSVRAVEQFMRDYYLHADAIRHFTNHLFEESLSAVSSGTVEVKLNGRFVLSKGELSLLEIEPHFNSPESILNIFKIAHRNKVRLSPSLLHEIYKRRIDGKINFRVEEEVSKEFFKIFEARDGVSFLLEDMHEAGVLSLFLPEFEPLRRQVQHDAYHIYTTDMHSIFTVRELENIRNERLKDELPFLTGVASQIEDWALLLLAGLLHDIGKGVGKGHAERGASMVPAIALRLGLSDEQSDTLHFLVRNHLEMAQVSQKRDLSDPSLINRFAKLVGNEERLKMLVLLTVADQRAVGPEGFNEWKRALLLDLFLKALRALEKGVELWADFTMGREKIIKALSEKVEMIIGGERLAYNLKAMPQRFFLTRRADTLARYLILLEKLTKNDILVCEHVNDVDNKNTELVLSTWDVSGLFYKIAGVLSSNGVNILSADIYTRADGAVLDIFRLNDPAGEIVEESKWKNIEIELKEAFQGKLDVAQRLKKRRRPTLHLKRMPYKPPRVEFDLESSDLCTIIEVYAHDRVGLLFDITYTLTEMGLDIDRAIIATEVDHAADVFYVKNAEGIKVTGDAELEHIKSRLLQVIVEGEKEQIQ